MGVVGGCVYCPGTGLAKSWSLSSSTHMLGKPAQLYGVDWKGEELDHAHNLRQVQSWKDQFQR